MEIKAVIIENAEEWLKENMRYFSTDNVSAIYCEKIHSDLSIDLYDEEEDETKTFNMAQQVQALQKLADDLGKKIWVGGLKNGMDLADAGNWDVEVVDAFYQYIYHGELIYG